MAGGGRAGIPRPLGLAGGAVTKARRKEKEKKREREKKRKRKKRRERQRSKQNKHTSAMKVMRFIQTTYVFLC